MPRFEPTNCLWRFGYIYIYWVVPPPRMPVVNEGLGWDPLLKMVHNPGGHCYCEGATLKIYFIIHIYAWPPTSSSAQSVSMVRWLASVPFESVDLWNGLWSVSWRQLAIGQFFIFQALPAIQPKCAEAATEAAATATATATTTTTTTPTATATATATTTTATTATTTTTTHCKMAFSAPLFAAQRSKEVSCP